MQITRNHTATASYTDEDLLFFFQSDNERHFSKFYDRFSNVLFGLIIKWINDTEVAENLLQDVFLKAWRSRQLYDVSKGRLFTWLYNITRNICIDHLRSKAYKKSKVSVLSDNLPVLLPTVNADSYLPDTIGLRKLLSSLRDEEKKVIELMYFEGLTQQQIAETMDIPLGTVKTRMSRAIKNLRSIFTKDWAGATQAIALN